MQLPTLLSVGLLAISCEALALAAPAPAPTPAALLPRLRGSEWVNYTTITGFFLQDDVATVPGTFDYVCKKLTIQDLPFPSLSISPLFNPSVKWDIWWNGGELLNAKE